MVSDLVDLFHYQRHRKWAFLHPLGRVPWFFKNSGCGQQGMNSYHFIALGILNLSFCLDFERCSLVVGSVVSLMIQLLFQVRILDMKSTKTQLNLTFKFPSLQQKKTFPIDLNKKEENLLNKKWLWLGHRAGLLFAIIITWSRCITWSRPRALAAQCGAVTWWKSGKRTCQRGDPGS